MNSAVLSSATETLIVGVDEAGRGAIAGPVTAAACVLPKLKKYPVEIGDSKQMSPQSRSDSYEWLIQHCLYGVSSVDAATIDKIGIMASDELAMQQAVKQISVRHSDLYLLVDGRDAFWFDHPHSSIIRGDSLELCIGAASIIAKVTRDRFMVEQAHEFPQYGFDGHKGYGAPEHQECIRKHGFCVLHRQTFCKGLSLVNSL